MKAKRCRVSCAGFAWSALAAVIVVTAAGCGYSGPMGEVQGTVVGIGGPPGDGFTSEHPLPEEQATVTLRGPDGLSISAHAGAGGKFSVDVPPGRYTVTGRSSDVLHQDDCSASGAIMVTAGGTTAVALTCPIP